MMKIPQMIAAEFRRLFSTRMSIIALIALLCVPILYGGLYLWANQDPYGNLKNVPVALVVSDTGADINGTQRNLGEEVGDELLGSDSFQWHKVSDAAATAGLDDGTYDFAVEIPDGFSAAIASISEDSPRRAELILRTNDANNYLASTIGKSAIETIQRTVTSKVVAEAGLTMLDALNTIRISLVDATDGATQIVDGLATAEDGTTQLSDGAAQLLTGTGTLVSGSATLADGSSQVADGAASLADGTAQIHTGAASLAEGNAQLATGLDTLTDGANQVSEGTGKLAGIADTIGDAAQSAADAVPAAREDIAKLLRKQGLTEAEITQVLARLDPLGDKLTGAVDKVQGARADIDRLNDGAAQVASGAGQLRDGAHTASDGANQLSAATETAATGAATLSGGANQVRDGAAQLRDGAVTLNAGAETLAAGIGTLGTGIDALHEGATTLRDGLADGVEQIPNSTDATRKAQASTLGEPVEVRKSSMTAAENYGAGLAPFFAALAAWIGIYALFLIVKPISRRAVTALHSPIRVTLAGWATPALLGAVQMIGLFAVLSITLGFQFANPIAALGLLVLASATYTAIILALNVWFGSVGQFIGLVLMVLQLVTAGGTFPWQTLPGPLAALHNVLPMGYVVDAMRQIMYGSGGWDRVQGDIGVLLVWLVGAVALAAIGVARMTRRRTLRDLEPSLIG